MLALTSSEDVDLNVLANSKVAASLDYAMTLLQVYTACKNVLLALAHVYHLASSGTFLDISYGPSETKRAGDKGKKMMDPVNATLKQETPLAYLACKAAAKVLKEEIARMHAVMENNTFKGLKLVIDIAQVENVAVSIELLLESGKMVLIKKIISCYKV